MGRVRRGHAAPRSSSDQDSISEAMTPILATSGSPRTASSRLQHVDPGPALGDDVVLSRSTVFGSTRPRGLATAGVTELIGVLAVQNVVRRLSRT